MPGTGGPWTEHPGPVATTNSNLLPQDMTAPGLSHKAKSSESAKVTATRFGPTSEERTLKPESTCAKASYSHLG